MKMGCVLVSSFCAMLFVTWGCRSDAVPRAADLQRDALATHAAYIQAVNAGTEKRGEEIPAGYWAEGIKALHPVKVYTHRVNIVVVQRVSGQTEEGKYIYIPISSYLPQSGDDGFVFTPDSRSSVVFDFKRTRSH